jgi:hypothetical protein
MAGLGPAIHVSVDYIKTKSWVTGTYHARPTIIGSGSLITLAKMGNANAAGPNWLVNKTAKGGDNDKRVSETIDSAIVALNIQITEHLQKCWNAVPEAVVRRVDPKDNPKGVG